MQVLICCNTYMQLITAIQLREKIYMNDIVDLIISDHSVGAEEVYERLKNAELFHRVSFCQNRYTQHEQGSFADIADIFRGIFSVGKKYRSFFLSNRLTSSKD